MAARPPSSCLEPRCVGPGKLPQHHHGASAILGTCTQTRGMDVHVHEYTPCRAVLLLLQGPGATSRTTRACTHATLCCCCCRGQMLPPGESAPVCSPSNAVDFELEMVSSSRSGGAWPYRSASLGQDHNMSMELPPTSCSSAGISTERHPTKSTSNSESMPSYIMCAVLMCQWQGVG